MQLYLASASPRRLELLRQIGLEPRLLQHSAVELANPGETPAELVLRLAEVKARLALEGLDREARPGVILAGDTAVVIGRQVLGKPRDPVEARAMLGLLRGKAHEVLTGVFLLRTDDGRSTSGVETTRVIFRDWDDGTLRNYVASGEPLDKAGAYGIQGGGAALIERIEGSWSNVVGLPLARLPEWLARLGLDLAQLRRDSQP